MWRNTSPRRTVAPTSASPLARSWTNIEPEDSAKFLTDWVNRVIKTYESGHFQVQVVTTVVPDQSRKSGSRVLYEAFVVHPA